MSRFQFVADHRHAFEVKWLCALVEIARSSFYAWWSAADTRAGKTAADDELAARIRAVHEKDNTYGAPRITAELNDGVAALKCVYLAVMSLDPTGTARKRWTNRWVKALNAFDMTFNGRVSAGRK